ncbi:uncharacterized protein LOC128198215 isoform X1 [Bicyclus anynana]|uniref:Uncharacterized protein LOC128198215 isoform X1 n=1 Tax=Bicyclus anynana TaxID=110368 RepID=A0ABM3LH08_BICAN|nr:uncharacterized protein LOC128198215 isoform X1 [Bicyclus anynana]
MCDAKIKDLVKKRGSIKSRLTQFSTFLSLLNSGEHLSDIQIKELECRFRKIEQLYGDFESLQSEIEALTDPPETAYQDREAFDGIYFRLVSEAQVMLNSHLSTQRRRSSYVKAVHLELVTDLTKEAYLACLNRFTSRRGKPETIYSDNASTFIGASNELAQFLKGSVDYVQAQLAEQGINFKYIPAYSPHFGGIWEAAVKSVKHHLRRVLSLTHFDYEEMATCLAQIEAVLNSRPLTPLSTDPSDLSYLSPSHFLIGRPLLATAQANLLDKEVNRLQRYQRVEKLRQHFWQRYSLEYVSLLQTKGKWRQSMDKLKIGALVLVKDRTQPPLLWLMGRVTNIIYGGDSIGRVAQLNTKKGIITRAFNNICPLPLDDISPGGSML